MPTPPTLAYAVSCNQIGPISFTNTGTNNQNISEDVAGSTTDHEFDVVFTEASLKSVFLITTVDMTVKTNATSGGGTEQVFTFKAGVPMIWDSNSPITNPFTSDVTKFYLTNAGTVAGTFYGLILTG